MQVIKPGHYYEVEVNGPSEPSGSTPRQFLQFVEKEEKQPGLGQLDVVVPGTTTEEVLDVLIDRMQFLDNKVSSPFNQQAIEHLTMAKAALASRTRERQDRGVEGTNRE